MGYLTNWLKTFADPNASRSDVQESWQDVQKGWQNLTHSGADVLRNLYSGASGLAQGGVAPIADLLGQGLERTGNTISGAVHGLKNVLENKEMQDAVAKGVGQNLKSAAKYAGNAVKSIGTAIGEGAGLGAWKAAELGKKTVDLMQPRIGNDDLSLAGAFAQGIKNIENAKNNGEYDKINAGINQNWQGLVDSAKRVPDYLNYSLRDLFDAGIYGLAGLADAELNVLAPALQGFINNDINRDYYTSGKLNNVWRDSLDLLKSIRESTNEVGRNLKGISKKKIPNK